MKASLRQLTLVGIIVLFAIAAGIGLLQTRRSNSSTPVLSVNQNPNTSNPPDVASSSMPPQDLAEARPDVKPTSPVEEIAGIGAMLGFDRKLGAIVIQGSVPNSPAAEAGLNSGLILSKIDDTFTEGLKLSECVELVRGAPGTVVRLEVVDPEQNETNALELTRRQVVVPPASRGPVRIERKGQP